MDLQAITAEQYLYSIILVGLAVTVTTHVSKVTSLNWKFLKVMQHYKSISQELNRVDPISCRIRIRCLHSAMSNLLKRSYILLYLRDEMIEFDSEEYKSRIEFLEEFYDFLERLDVSIFKENHSEAKAEFILTKMAYTWSSVAAIYNNDICRNADESETD